MSKRKIFLCGEGSNELGSRFKPAAFQHDREPGVLHALLERVQPSGWEIGGARDWKGIRKFRVGGAKHADTHNVLGAAKDAIDAGCDVLVFARDRDKDLARVDAVEEGIARVAQIFARPPEVVGAVAVPLLEGWILALLRVRRTEELAPKRAEEDLIAKGVPAKDREAMVRVIEEADLDQLPDAAASLRLWLTRAAALSPRS